jgi:predicted nucleic acid-binding protein
VSNSWHGKTIPPAINTSPLIFLTKGGVLELLQIIGQEIVVPSAVATEIQAYGATDITAVALLQTNWLSEIKGIHL